MEAIYNRRDETIMKPSLNVSAGNLRTSYLKPSRTLPKEFEKHHVFDVFKPDTVRSNQSYRNVPTYVDDILSFLDQSDKLPQPQIIELMNPGFTKNYPSLYDWLYSIFMDLDIVNVEVFLTAIATFLRCMQQQTFPSLLMQRACMLACLWICCKLESQQNNPTLENLLNAAPALKIKKKLLCEMESMVLNLLDFDLLLPTSRYFVRRYGRVCSLEMSHLFLCNYLCYLAMRDLDLFEYPPSMVAAGVVATCFRVSNFPFVWTKTMHYYSGYSFDQVKCICIKLMDTYKSEQNQWHLDRKSNVRRATPIFYNYTQSSFMSVSTLGQGDKWNIDNSLIDGSMGCENVELEEY